MELNSTGKYLLGLHSCSEKLGVAILDLNDPKKKICDSTFECSRELSNNLFRYVETLLPAKYWPQIARVAVAKGPGGFTGTRLTIAMARTLAQQLKCPLDGVSSFSLMVPRLATKLKPHEVNDSFWLFKVLKRRGTIGGQYKVNYLKSDRIETIELKEPHLLPHGIKLNPAINAEENVSEDLKELINFSLNAYMKKEESPWPEVLPIYPTSPLDSCN